MQAQREMRKDVGHASWRQGFAHTAARHRHVQLSSFMAEERMRQIIDEPSLAEFEDAITTERMTGEKRKALVVGRAMDLSEEIRQRASRSDNESRCMELKKETIRLAMEYSWSHCLIRPRGKLELLVEADEYLDEAVRLLTPSTDCDNASELADSGPRIWSHTWLRTSSGSTA